MNIYYDTEFHDTGEKIDLISIGLVADDGREYYAVNAEADWFAISKHKWLPDNVVRHLPLVFGEHTNDSYPYVHQYDSIDLTATEVKPRFVIANEVRDFIQATPDPKLWAYYGAHDHVALTQLWGPLTEAPDGIPWRTNDLEQMAEALGMQDHLIFGATFTHNALEDARWVRDAYKTLMDLRADRNRDMGWV